MALDMTNEELKRHIEALEAVMDVDEVIAEVTGFTDPTRSMKALKLCTALRYVLEQRGEDG